MRGKMRVTANRFVVIALFLGALFQVLRLWLPSRAGVVAGLQHQRGYFLTDMLLGAAFILQSVPLLDENASVRRKNVGTFVLAAGILCALMGVLVACQRLGAGH